MLDRDLAELYGVPTKRLNEQVKRTPKRFPADFMFRLTPAEMAHWKSQIATSNPGLKMSLRKPLHAFTEQGVAMLSSVLNCERAVLVNVSIMRAFARLCGIISADKDLQRELAKL